MPDLANLNYAPLSAKPSVEELKAYRAPREVPAYDEATGFDEQKAPATTGKSDSGLWERRYRFNALAEVNGLTYSFRSDPSRWPGNIATDTKIYDVLEGRDGSGRRFMTCAQDITRRKGAVGGGNVMYDNYVVLAIAIETKTPTAYFKHKWRTHADAPALLEANYTADDPYSVAWNPQDKAEHFDSAKPWLTGEVLSVVLKLVPDYDLYLAGGWLYAMKSFGFAGVEKKNADPSVLRSRFEVAAQLGPALAQAEAAVKAAGYDPDAERKRRKRERENATASAVDPRARAFVEKLMAEERAKNPDADQR